MDERLRDMGRRFAAEPGDVSMQGRLRQELYRLVAGGAREYLPPYVQAGGVWIEDLTNQCALLDAEGLPVEKGVPVFRFYGVKSRGKPLVVTVRDLLEQDLHNQVDYWLPRTRDHVYGNWQMPCAVGLMDTLDFLLGYQPSVPEQCVVRDRALAFFRGRLTYGTRLVTRRRTAYESRGADGVYDVYVGLDSLVFVPTLVGPGTLRMGRDDEALRALIGKSVRDTKRILKGVTGTSPRILRRDSRPFGRREGAVVLGRYVGDVSFLADDGGAALGWSSCPAQNFSKEKFE